MFIGPLVNRPEWKRATRVRGPGVWVRGARGGGVGAAAGGDRGALLAGVVVEVEVGDAHGRLADVRQVGEQA